MDTFETPTMPFTRRLLVALTLGLAAAAAHADDLTTGGGKKLTGKLVGIDAQGVTFTAGEAKVTVLGKEVILIDLGHKVSPLVKDQRVNEIELTDGSTFRAGKFSVKGRKIEAELLTIPTGVTAPTFELPLTAVFSVMRGAEDTKSREAWKKILVNRGKRDMYVMREADGLNFTQGTVLAGSDDGKTFDFELEGGKKADPPLLQSRATGGLVFAQPTPAQVPPMICKVLDVFGNVLVAQSVQLGSDGVVVTTVSGVVVKYPSVTGVAKFDYAQGNVAYLSDLEPQVDAPAIPADEKGLRVNVAPPVLRDVGVAGEALKLGNDPPYPKGIVIASDTQLTYNIGGDYRDFRAVLGVPDSALDASLGAKVTIELDGKVVFSETIRRKDKPKPIVLDVKGAKQLRVIVEGDSPVIGDRVVLADARIQK